MRSIENLEQNAIKFWPAEIAVQEKDISIIPKLIETQDKFISFIKYIRYKSIYLEANFVVYKIHVW